MSNDTSETPIRRLEPDERIGLVIASGRGGTWEVAINDAVVICRLRGRLKTSARDRLSHLAVGDRVIARRGDDPEEGVIEEVLPRRSRIGRGRSGRPPQLIAANVEQLVTVLAVREPEFTLHALDRYLALAAAAEVEPLVVLNKCDLDDDGAVQRRVVSTYPPLGYRVICTSAVTGQGLEALDDALAERISAVIGPSGTGKSSLLNALNPEYALRTGEVMSIGKGRHTTTETRLLRLDRGGYVADTPGIKTLSLIADEIEPLAVQHLFPEIDERFGTCRFADCSHRHEPRCAVREAAESGAIDPSRYRSYVRLFEELASARQR